MPDKSCLTGQEMRTNYGLPPFQQGTRFQIGRQGLFGTEMDFMARYVVYRAKKMHIGKLHAVRCKGLRVLAS